MKVVHGEPTTIAGSARAVAAGAAGGFVAGAIATTCPTCAIQGLGSQAAGLMISGVTGSVAGGVVTRAISGKKQTISAAQSDAIGGLVGVAAAGVFGKITTVLGNGAAESSLVKGMAQRAESAAANAGLGADKAAQQAATAIRTNYNAAGAAAGSFVGSVATSVINNVDTRNRQRSVTDGY